MKPGVGNRNAIFIRGVKDMSFCFKVMLEQKEVIREGKSISGRWNSKDKSPKRMFLNCSENSRGGVTKWSRAGGREWIQKSMS